jgi:DNA-binding transcriptional ArsR family regulator
MRMAGAACRQSSPAPARRYKLNYMVKCSGLDRTFGALADPTRREILERLAQGPASVSELAGPAGMSMPGLLKHVRILEQAQLVTTEKHGRVRQCRLDPGHLDDAAQWIQARRRWERRLDRLGAYLQRRTEREGIAP